MHPHQQTNVKMQMKVNQKGSAQAHKIRRDAETALRDIAFVLKMTQRVRAEMEIEQIADEPATV